MFNLPCKLRKWLRVWMMLLFCAGCPKAKAQSKDKSNVPYKPKVFQFSYQKLYANNPLGFEGNQLTPLEREANYRVSFNMLAPFVVKDDFLLGVQLKYDQQRFVFENFETSETSSLSGTLNQIDFRRKGVSLVGQKDFSNDQKLSFALSTNFNSDRFSLSMASLRSSLTGLYEKQISPMTSIGGGLRLSYDEQGVRVLPVFTYDKTINENWNLSLTLPKEAILRYRLSYNSFLSVKTELNSYRYILNDPLQGYEGVDLSIARLDFRASLLYEKQLTDWIGLGVEYGWSNRSRHFLVERGNRRRDALLEFRNPRAPYVKASLFIVPPSKFIK